MVQVVLLVRLSVRLCCCACSLIIGSQPLRQASSRTNLQQYLSRRTLLLLFLCSIGLLSFSGSCVQADFAAG